MKKNKLNKKIKKFISKGIINSDDISDTYHTFGELYNHRIALYIRLVNETLDKYKWIKSKYHYDGSEYKGWFIVTGYIPQQISYHLPIEKWDLVKCKAVKKNDKRDGHTSDDVIDRLVLYNIK